MPTKDIKREKRDCISRFQSHPRRITSTKLKSTPPSAVGSCQLEEYQQHSEGQAHHMHNRAASDAETSGEKHKQKNADNIEIPAKDDNITGGNSMDILSYILNNQL